MSVEKVIHKMGRKTERAAARERGVVGAEGSGWWNVRDAVRRDGVTAK